MLTAMAAGSSCGNVIGASFHSAERQCWWLSITIQGFGVELGDPGQEIGQEVRSFWRVDGKQVDMASRLTMTTSRLMRCGTQS
jgi:hypothetical protein